MAPLNIAILYPEFGTPIQLRAWLEVAQTASVLRAAGHEPRVHLLKATRHRDQVLGSFAEDLPSLIFIPIGREQSGPTRHILDALHEKINPEGRAAVVVGGVMGTLSTQEYSSHPAVRGIVLGDWYESIEELSIAIATKGNPHEVASVWWRAKAGWVLAPNRKRLRTIADLPEPDLEVFRVKDLLKVTGGTLPLSASRGFPFRSLFSSEPLTRHLQEAENYYEMLKPSEVIRRAANLLDKFDPKRFEFVDEIFPWNPRWVERFATEWAQEICLPFACTMAAEHFNDENMELMAGAGLKVARINLESGNDQFRARFADINVTNGTVREAVGIATACRVRVEARVLLGVPDETPSTLAETLNFIERLPFAGIHPEVFVPWPRMTAWTETDPSPTIATEFLCKPVTERPELMGPLQRTFDRLLEVDSMARARTHQRDANAVIDAISDFQLATVRSPLARPLRIASFAANDGEHDVVALRVPSEISWKTKIAADSVIRFGILLEPTLPGLRSRLPISFSIKIGQNGRYYRLFQKILLQALDPDSRRWHFFVLPLKPARLGEAEIILESTLFGREPDEVPTDGDVWAGWAGVIVGSAHDIQSARDSGMVHTGDI